MSKQIAYLGPKGTYAEKAAHILSKLANFQTPIFVPCNGLNSVIKTLAYNNCDAAVVPIENSVEGGVSATLDALWKFPDINIIRAIVIPIKHALISNGRISEISEVLSHPQALAQCSEWLSENLPEAITLSTNSTSEAVSMVKGSKFRAAIGSKSLIKIEGLKELAFPINDVPGNCTRFVLLSKESISENADIASFAFSLLSNKPGALLKALTHIADFGFNMSKIESRPSKRELGEYIIYVDVEISDQQKIKNIFELKKILEPLCENFIDFGCYKSDNVNLD
tara:strand:+ start:147 stop:992 length:846 start_codon:yes stop_codon:yes gene_type:complete